MRAFILPEGGWIGKCEGLRERAGFDRGPMLWYHTPSSFSTPAIRVLSGYDETVSFLLLKKAMDETAELTPRQQTILGLTVREYVKSASPVSSRALVNRYGLPVSSATVRN